MSKELRDADYLEHIQEAIRKIQRYVADKSETDFMADDLVQDGVIRNLEIIGEAVTELSPKLKAANGHVSWGEIAGMRNRLIHGYISVNLLIPVAGGGGHKPALGRRRLAILLVVTVLRDDEFRRQGNHPA